MSSNGVDVIIQLCTDGWRYDAYVAGTANPAGQPEAVADLRFLDPDEAERDARRRYGPRISLIETWRPT